jgi:hypothetical protein
MPSFSSSSLHAADQGVGVALGQRGQQLDQPPVGLERGKDRGVLDLAGHDDFGDPFGVEDVDEAAELGDAQPVAGDAQALDLGRRVVADREDDHFVAELPGGFERENREPAAAGDQTISH